MMLLVSRHTRALLLCAWLLTAVVDFLFASALTVFAYGSTVARLWQGVAATLLGASAFDGGVPTVLIGVVMHVGVAFAWSAVFLALATMSPRLRRATASPAGILAVAVVYGPCVWLVMSFVVIPFFTGRPPAVTFRWWVQVAGHVPFVALPIVAVIGRGLNAKDSSGRRPVPQAAS